MFEIYDLPSMVFGFVICLITGIIIGVINFLFEKALLYREERKFFKENYVMMEDNFNE